MEIEKYIVLADKDLVGLALEGDTRAFERLLTRYRDSLYQIYLQRLGGNRDDANDMMQEAVIKIYLNLDRYNPEYTFGQWVYTIARNTFIDFIRRRRDELSLDHIPESLSGISADSFSPSPEESVINSQQRSQIEHHLTKMTPRYRRLIELRFFKDYSYEEIAAELSLPMGTVKTQIHRARKQLCKFITERSDILK